MAEQTSEKKQFDYEGEIWKIANFVWGPIKTSEFNRVILPFTMLRRLECALEPTRDAVIKAIEEHEKEWGNENKNYCQFSRMAFYNTTSFRLNSLGAIDTLDALNSYIDGFSPNAREIMKKFKMEETCKTLDSHGMLYSVCTQFAAFDLSPEAVSDREMSNIYEHLIEKFGESIAENAEDFMTPKDIVRLATSMVFAGDDEIMNSDTGIVRTLYDSCLGTGGFITDALDQLEEWHSNKVMKAPARIVPYGEEVEPESWAMAKAALLLRNISGNGADIYDMTKDNSEFIMYGNTLTDDKFPEERFDYILTNPPYGKPYKVEQDDILEEAKNGFLGRFGAGLPSVDDSSMLFLQNVVNKLKTKEEGGGKAAIILSGSPLFTGDAGSGPSNIRRWLFKEDVIDCIVKLGDQEFFRTGINTYLWCLSTKKPENRKGKIQLIDASDMKTLLRKNMGNKRYEVAEADRERIVKTYIDGIIDDKSVIVPVENFMYRKVTTQRPLRMKIKITDELEKKEHLLESAGISKLSKSNFMVLYNALLNKKNILMSYDWADEIAKTSRKAMEKAEATASQLSNAIRNIYGVKDSSFDPVLNKDGSIIPDPDLKDTESIPFGTSFDDYMNTEVLPYANDTWIDETVVDKGPLADGKVGIVGTNISFNKYFYHYEEPRNPQEIKKEIFDIEEGIETFDISKICDSATETKDSGIKWIGRIPSNWDVVPLKSQFSFGKGLPITKADLIENGLPVISYGQIHSKQCSGTGLSENLLRYVDYKYNSSNPLSETQNGDIIVADTSEDLEGCGNAVLNDREYPVFAGYHTIILRKTSENNTKYFAYLFRTDRWRSQIREQLTDVKLFSVSQKTLKQTQVIIPDIEEQNRIVSYLDTANAKIDEVIAHHKEAIERLEEYRKSLIHNAVLGKIDCRKEKNED